MSDLRGTATKRRHKLSEALKKPFWLTRRRSKIKLPTRFLLGGTISDPLNLQGLQKESDRQSSVHSFETNSQVSLSKRSRRIGFPNIADASDPLNLKNISGEERESSEDCMTSMEIRKNTDSKNHCQVLHTLPHHKTEDRSKQRLLCLNSSAEVKEKMSPRNNSATSCNRSPHCINNCNIDEVPVVATCKIASNISDHFSSDCSDVEALASTHSSKSTSREKIVSPVVPQFSHYRARKRQRRSAHADKETVPFASRSHKSCKKSKEKFPCGNYVGYYGYRNVDRVEDPRLKLLPKELFEGKDVLDIGCNAGIVTIAVASTYLPKSILGIDVDQRLIGLAKRNVRRYMDENSYPLCLKTAFGPIATSLMPSSECSAFPHNILFQVVKFLHFMLTVIIVHSMMIIDHRSIFILTLCACCGTNLTVDYIVVSIKLFNIYVLL